MNKTRTSLATLVGNLVTLAVKRRRSSRHTTPIFDLGWLKPFGFKLKPNGFTLSEYADYSDWGRFRGF